MDVQLQSFDSREDWLAARRLGIGASESAAIFGVSRFDSRLSLWAKKRGEITDEIEATERLELGLAMEPAIAAIYQRRTERQLWAPKTPWTIARHPRLPMTASVDRWVIEAPDREGRGVLEIKNVNAFMGDDWEHGAPLPYQIQLQHQLAVTGFGWGSIVGLVGGDTVKHYDYERNDEFIGELEAQCEAFWATVERGEMPPVDESKHTVEAIKRLYRGENGLTAKLDAEAAAAWDELVAARAAESAAKKSKETLTARLLAAIGPNSYGRLPDDRVISAHTVSCEARVQKVDAYSYRVLRIDTKKGAKRK